MSESARLHNGQGADNRYNKKKNQNQNQKENLHTCCRLGLSLKSIIP